MTRDRARYDHRMRAFLKFLGVLVVLALVAGLGAWVWAGRAVGPSVQIRQPENFIGQTTALEVMVEAPGGRFTQINVAVEQNGKTLPVFVLGQPAQAGVSAARVLRGGVEADVKQDTAERIYISRPIGKRNIPELQPGAARIVVRASRPVLYGLRQAESTAARDVQVRLEPPRVAVLSTHHYINHGGAEFVVYRATPPDVESGVRVGDETYPGFPGSAVGIAEPAPPGAFFALLHDQDLNAPIDVFARDAAGNQATAPLDHRAFPKPFARSRIQIDDRFLQRVVPAIRGHTPHLPG